MPAYIRLARTVAEAREHTPGHTARAAPNPPAAILRTLDHLAAALSWSTSLTLTRGSDERYRIYMSDELDRYPDGRTLTVDAHGAIIDRGGPPNRETLTNVEYVSLPDETALQHTRDHAMLAFWACVAHLLPAVTCGGMAPGEAEPLDDEALEAIRVWVESGHRTIPAGEYRLPYTVPWLPEPEKKVTAAQLRRVCQRAMRPLWAEVDRRLPTRCHGNWDEARLERIALQTIGIWVANNHPHFHHRRDPNGHARTELFNALRAESA